MALHRTQSILRLGRNRNACTKTLCSAQKLPFFFGILCKAVGGHGAGVGDAERDAECDGADTGADEEVGAWQQENEMGRAGWPRKGKSRSLTAIRKRRDWVRDDIQKLHRGEKIGGFTRASGGGV